MAESGTRAALFQSSQVLTLAILVHSPSLYNEILNGTQSAEFDRDFSSEYAMNRSAPRSQRLLVVDKAKPKPKQTTHA